MFKRLYGYLESCNILYPIQFGFRQKCSTNHALIQITESIRNSIDNNEFGCGIFTDLNWNQNWIITGWEVKPVWLVSFVSVQ